AAPLARPRRAAAASDAAGALREQGRRRLRPAGVAGLARRREGEPVGALRAGTWVRNGSLIGRTRPVWSPKRIAHWTDAAGSCLFSGQRASMAGAEKHQQGGPEA